MQRLAVAALTTMLLGAACGTGEPAGLGPSTEPSEEPPPATTTPVPDPAQLYEADVTVLEAEDGPMLCLGATLAIYPPQCGDIPVTNWDWDAVEGEQSDQGVTWGTFHVVGTYADGGFTVAETGPYDPAGEFVGTDPDFTTPCPEPEGGWVDVDPALASERDFQRGAARAADLPGYVALWVRYVGSPTPEELDQLASEGKPLPQKIMNVVVTEDAAGAEAAIREVWGGPLCLVEREGRTGKELKAIRAEAERWLHDELGLTMTWSQDGPLGVGAAEIGVWVDPNGAGQAALDERYGAGMVRLFPALRPVG